MSQSGRTTVITVESDDDDRADSQWAARFSARLSPFPVGVCERLFRRLGSPPGVIEFATRPSEQSTSELPVAIRFAPSVLEVSTFARRGWWIGCS